MTERQHEGAKVDPDEMRAGAPSVAAEDPANRERDPHMKQAIDAARREAEERATAEILALEEDLEKERERAARSLEELQRRLEEAETRSAA